MTIPRLNRQLTLETPVRVADGAGGYTEAWTVLGQLWAEVSSRSGRERAEAGVPVSAVSHRIVVRGAPYGSISRPDAKQRFREAQRLFVIQAVTERDTDGKYLICFADEEVVT